MEELADDVSGGSDAEDDCPDNLLPPGQQQHGVLPPTVLRPCPVLADQTHGAIPFLPVALAVREVVAVVYKEERQEVSKVQVLLLPT